jgi:hypothetical protein
MYSSAERSTPYAASESAGYVCGPDEMLLQAYSPHIVRLPSDPSYLPRSRGEAGPIRPRSSYRMHDGREWGSKEATGADPVRPKVVADPEIRRRRRMIGPRSTLTE